MKEDVKEVIYYLFKNFIIVIGVFALLIGICEIFAWIMESWWRLLVFGAVVIYSCYLEDQHDKAQETGMVEIEDEEDDE